MLHSAAPRHADAVFAQLERGTRDPVRLYRRLLRRAALQLNAVAVEADGLRATIRQLQNERRERGAQTRRLQQQLADAHKQRVSADTTRNSSGDLMKGKTPAAFSSSSPPLSLPQRSATTESSATATHDTALIESLLSNVLLLLVSDELTEASQGPMANATRDVCAGGRVADLYGAITSSVSLLKEREAVLRRRVRELEESAQRDGATSQSCPSYHRVPTAATEAVGVVGSRDAGVCSSFISSFARFSATTASDAATSSRRTNGRGPTAGDATHDEVSDVSSHSEATDTSADGKMDDLADEAELEDYAEWRQLFVEEFLSSK